MRFAIFVRFWAVLCWALMVTQPAGAAVFGATQCAGTRFNSNLVCTANDVSITGMSVVGGPPSCSGGDSITVDLDVTVNFATPDRWDIGIFLSNDGKDPQVTAANGGAASCTVAVLPTTAPFLDLDGFASSGVVDTCGDGNGAINGGTGSGVLRITGVQVPCQALGSTGLLYIPFVVSWDNSKSPAGDACTSNLNPVPNTKSKCNAPTVAQGSVGVVVLPKISKTDGITSITPGDTTTYTITLANRTGITLSTAGSNAAVLKDPTVSNLTLNSISCAVTAGTATCPTSTTPTAGTGLSIANLQGSGVTIPSMATNSTMTFTVVATLSGNPTGTLTNVATVTANGQTASASDANTIVYPVLTSQKTVTTLTDPINGAVNPKRIPGAEVLYSITISNTGLGTVNRDVMKITDHIPSDLEFYSGDLGAVNSGPISFTPGSPSSNLSYTYTSLSNTTDGIEFSNNNGSTYVYIPTGGYDSNVTNIRVSPKGKMAAWSGTGAYPSFTLGFKARIK